MFDALLRNLFVAGAGGAADRSNLQSDRYSLWTVQQRVYNTTMKQLLHSGVSTTS